jgi:two-component system chemotaxis response regulator CheY
MASILVVEDSIAMRQIVSFTLTSAGHEVSEVSDAGKVLRLMGRRKFDLVISDVNMPGMNGIDLVQSLGGVPLCRIVKPFDPEVLLETLKRVL